MHMEQPRRLPSTLAEYRRDWEPRLLSDDPAVRQSAIADFIVLGMASLNPEGIGDAVKKKVNLVHEFARATHASDPLIGGQVEFSLGAILRLNWTTVQEYLLNPWRVREEIVRANPGAGEVLLGNEGWAWLQGQCAKLYDYFKAVAWDVRCESCGNRVRPRQFLVRYEAQVTQGGDVYIRSRHYFCTSPRCRARYIQLMASDLPPASREQLERELERARAVDPALDRELRRAESHLKL